MAARRALPYMLMAIATVATIVRANSLSRSDRETDAFKPSVFLNIGIGYQSDGFRADLHLHNTLGWVEADLNKRNFYARLAGYRNEAAAVSLQISFDL